MTDFKKGDLVLHFFDIRRRKYEFGVILNEPIDGFVNVYWQKDQQATRNLVEYLRLASEHETW